MQSIETIAAQKLESLQESGRKSDAARAIVTEVLPKILNEKLMEKKTALIDEALHQLETMPTIRNIRKNNGVDQNSRHGSAKESVTKDALKKTLVLAGFSEAEAAIISDCDDVTDEQREFLESAKG